MNINRFACVVPEHCRRAIPLRPNLFGSGHSTLATEWWELTLLNLGAAILDWEKQFGRNPDMTKTFQQIVSTLLETPESSFYSKSSKKTLDAIGKTLARKGKLYGSIYPGLRDIIADGFVYLGDPASSY